MEREQSGGRQAVAARAVAAPAAVSVRSTFVRYAVWTLLALALTQVLLAASVPAFTSGQFYGADSYMHMLRVERLHDVGAWYDNSYPRTNAPWGAPHIWSHPFDVIVLLGALALEPLLGWHRALFISGFLVSPVLLWGVLLAWYPLARRLAGDHVVMAGVFGALVPTTWFVAPIARPDHHGLNLLMFAAFLGALLVATLEERPSRGRLFAAGLLGGFALWVSVEALLVVAIGVAIVGVCWTWRGGRLGLWTAAGLAAGGAMAIVAEYRPAQWMHHQLDRFSFTYQVPLLVYLALWGLLALAERRGWLDAPLRRGLALVGLGVIGLGGILAYEPIILKGPWGALDPRLAKYWLDSVSELDPLGPTEYLLYLGMPLAGLAAAGWQAWHTRRPRMRFVWGTLAAVLVIYSALTLHQRRWFLYPQLLGAVPLASVFGPFLDRVVPRRGLASALARAAVILCAAAAAPVPGFDLAAAYSHHTPDTCPTTEMDAWLANPKGMGATPKIVAAELFDGPQILWQTPHSIIAGPYHCNPDGISDLRALFFASDDQVARRIVDKRGVDLLVECPERKTFIGGGGPDSLYWRLARGDVPSWLRKLSLPPDLAAHYDVFQVVPDAK